MAAPKTKSPQQRTALRLEIYQRYCCGQTQVRIAEALGLDQSVISYHIRKARDANQIEIESRRTDRLAELSHLRSEAWAAWQRELRTPQAAVFLGLIQKAIAQERVLLGLDAQKSVSASVTFSELPHDTIDSVIGGPQES